MLTDNINLEVHLYHLAGYVVNLEAYTNILHEEVHLLHNALNPPEAPEAAEEGPVVIQVDSDTSEDEAEDGPVVIQVDSDTSEDEAEELEVPAPDEDVNKSGSDMDDD